LYYLCFISTKVSLQLILLSKQFPRKMANFLTVDRKLFDWDYSEEPHRSRRIEILGMFYRIHLLFIENPKFSGKYPEIKKLMSKNGDRFLFYAGITVLVAHFCLAWFATWLVQVPLRFLVITMLGTWTATMCLVLSHEAAHGTIFGPNFLWRNRMFGYVLNFAIGSPFFAFFKQHHKLHHKVGIFLKNLSFFHKFLLVKC